MPPVDFDFLVFDEDRVLTAYQEDVINTSIRVFSKMLEIESDVTLLRWDNALAYLKKQGYSKNEAVCELTMYYGQAFFEINSIFINPRLASTANVIMDTVFHELTHIKHPEWSEDKVEGFTNYYFLDTNRGNKCNANRKRKGRT